MNKQYNNKRFLVNLNSYLAFRCLKQHTSSKSIELIRDILSYKDDINIILVVGTNDKPYNYYLKSNNQFHPNIHVSFEYINGCYYQIRNDGDNRLILKKYNHIDSEKDIINYLNKRFSNFINDIKNLNIRLGNGNLKINNTNVQYRLGDIEETINYTSANYKITDLYSVNSINRFSEIVYRNI